MEQVIEKIITERKKKGYSHEYVAHELGISQAAYSKLEKLDTKLTVERLYKLAEILETKVENLLEVNPNNVYNQNNNDTGTFVGYQGVENLYQENKEKTEKIIALYEARLKDKEDLIEALKRG